MKFVEAKLEAKKATLTSGEAEERKVGANPVLAAPYGTKNPFAAKPKAEEAVEEKEEVKPAPKAATTNPFGAFKKLPTVEAKAPEATQEAHTVESTALTQTPSTAKSAAEARMAEIRAKYMKLPTQSEGAPKGPSLLDKLKR